MKRELNTFSPQFGERMETRFLINCCRILSTLFILLLTIPFGPFNSLAQGEYVGCFNDKHKRDLDGFWTRVNTIQECIRKCRDKSFYYAGLQAGSHCFCGNSYGRYEPANENKCNKPCLGDHSQICGGFWANSVYATRPATPAKGLPWQERDVRNLIDEWLRQVQRCAQRVHPGSYIDKWGMLCGQLKTTTADCSMPPDHPVGWDNYHYLWAHNWCPQYFRFRLQDYVSRRQTGASSESLYRCKSSRNVPCF